MKMSIDRVLTTIVEKMLPRFTEDKMLAITLQYIVSKYYESGEEAEVYKLFTFIFKRSSNYTQVLYVNKSLMNITDETVLDQQAYHDSCWNSDGFRVLQKIEREAVEELVKLHHEICKNRKNFEELCANDISEYISFDLTSPCYIQGELKKVSDFEYRIEGMKIITGGK